MAAPLAVKAATRGPGDSETLDSFAHEYNRYVAELREGIVDLKQWQRVEKAWNRLAGKQFSQ